MSLVAAKISGVGIYIPKRKITNEDAIEFLKKESAQYLNNEELGHLISGAKYIIEKTGSKTRYWCEENEYCTDIAAKAALNALEDAGLTGEDIDMVIFTAISKAFMEPANAHAVRTKIGAINANVIDAQDACASFIKSFELANALIKAGSYKRVLVVSGERLSEFADFGCKTLDETVTKLISLTIGDAGGAIVVEATDDPCYTEDKRHMQFFYNIKKDTYDVCSVGFNKSGIKRYLLFTHSKELLKIGYEIVPEIVSDVFSQEEWKNSRFDNYFHHDIGTVVRDGTMLVLKEAGVHISHTFKSYYPDYGNVAAVNFPLGMWITKQEGKLKRGNLALGLIAASGVQVEIAIFKY